MNAAEVKLEHSEISALYKVEKSGMQAYRAGDYALAYEKLSKTAPLGFKQSQYYLAYLYLKGQHVKKSMLDGMAWLGVAKESGHKEMLTLFDSLYNSFNQAQKDAVDKKINEYIALYGMENQNIVCEKRKKVGSKRRVLECVKIPIKVDYEINTGPTTMQ
jgi:TPR repeat protein